MGEATYYFKAIFKTKEDAQKSFDKIREYLRQNNEAYDYWQDKRNSKNPQLILNNLKKKYPQVMKLINVDKVTTNMNELSGNFIEIMEDITDNLEIIGNEIQFSGMTWHFADWRTLEVFCLKLGAVNAKWISDEYTDYWQVF